MDESFFEKGPRVRGVCPNHVLHATSESRLSRGCGLRVEILDGIFDTPSLLGVSDGKKPNEVDVSRFLMASGRRLRNASQRET